MIGSLLRALGRLAFRWADRLSPDPVTVALDSCYAPEPLAVALEREVRERGQSAQSAAIARDIERLRGVKSPHPPVVTPFSRKAARLRTLR
jgi:hypothetical protein